MGAPPFLDLGSKLCKGEKVSWVVRMYAVMLSLLLTVEAGSSPGFIIFLKSDLGQVTDPLWTSAPKGSFHQRQ